MALSDTEQQVTLLFRHLLRRAPSPSELVRWTAFIQNGTSFHICFQRMTETIEYKAKNGVSAAWPNGHFYSPVVNPDDVVKYVTAAKQANGSDILGIDVDIEAMKRHWLANKAFIAATPFKRDPVPSLRYFWSTSPYPIGDAVTYRLMIGSSRPRRIVEIGCGYSSACALDTLDEICALDVSFTCIDPNPDALKSFLRPTDVERVEVIASQVQNVSLAVFEALERDDILFIDSAHVLKTGSDVHFELFHILPRLSPGVKIHFHDIRWPFEYPDAFIFSRNYSWNEAYGVRALLMHSTKFKVSFCNGAFVSKYRQLAFETFPDFLKNFGSSLWVDVL